MDMFTGVAERFQQQIEDHESLDVNQLYDIINLEDTVKIPRSMIERLATALSNQYSSVEDMGNQEVNSFLTNILYGSLNDKR